MIVRSQGLPHFVLCALCVSVASFPWAPFRSFAAGVSVIEEAERLAKVAVELAVTQPEAALAQARTALALTGDFEPTAFVKAGRKGEVFEDAYLEARREYRRHRARLYEAVGICLARPGRHAEAARYLRRSLDLDPNSETRLLLARSQVALGRGRHALDTILSDGAEELAQGSIAVASAAADLAGLPSLQLEIDRARFERLKERGGIEFREGPFRLPERARLSTGAPFRVDGAASTLLYLAEPSCRSCSADLTTLEKALPPGGRPVMAPAIPDQDQALRQTLALYGLAWPVLLGHGSGGVLGIDPPALLVVARGGWAAAVVRPPFAERVPAVLALFGRSQVQETIPRPAWNHRTPERGPVARPGLLPEGLAAGEDEPAPQEFVAAVEAFRSGRAAEALRLFDALAANGDGWLLPPEARLNRALCLAALGRREEARRLLLRTGDSRFQEAVDRTLERVGTPRRSSR